MSTPAERIWTVDTYYVREVADPITGQPVTQWVPDPNALPIALAELNGLMTRVGGVVQMATRRHEISKGRVETVAVVFRWRSFVPVDRSQEAPAHEQDGTEAQAAAPPLAPVPDLPPEDEPIPAEKSEPKPEPAAAP